MNPEEFHRKKLKDIGYMDEVIERLVSKYMMNRTYEFAERYHYEQLSINVVMQAEPEKVFDCEICHKEITSGICGNCANDISAGI